MLGEDGAVALRHALVARARRWAAAVAPDVAFEATSGGAVSVALHDHDGPVLVASWDVPGLDVGLAEAALADLEAGAALSFAPAMDGRPYLVAMPAVDHELLEELADGHPDRLFARATAAEGGMGMLRSERRLVSAADARALAADPLAPEDLVALLAPALRVRRTGD